SFIRIITVLSDILTGDVGEEGSVAVFLPVHYQTTLLSLPSAAIAAGTEENSQFERHVESRQARGGVEPGPREIVDPKFTLLDNLEDLLDADFAGILRLQRAAKLKATVGNGKRDRLEHLLIGTVKRTIQEDVTLVIG